MFIIVQIWAEAIKEVTIYSFLKENMGGLGQSRINIYDKLKSKFWKDDFRSGDYVCSLWGRTSS